MVRSFSFLLENSILRLGTGHSMTIIGFEIRDKGHANLLVFDPTYKTPATIKHSTATTFKTPDPARILKGYRRGGEYLQKYQNFEILKYVPNFSMRLV
jgi:hypothetical protein